MEVLFNLSPEKPKNMTVNIWILWTSINLFDNTLAQYHTKEIDLRSFKAFSLGTQVSFPGAKAPDKPRVQEILKVRHSFPFLWCLFFRNMCGFWALYQQNIWHLRGCPYSLHLGVDMSNGWVIAKDPRTEISKQYFNSEPTSGAPAASQSGGEQRRLVGIQPWRLLCHLLQWSWCSHRGGRWEPEQSSSFWDEYSGRNFA